MLRSVDALRRQISEPLCDSCGPYARMLTAEAHGGFVCGLAICPGRVVRYEMDDKTQCLKTVDLLRLTPSAGNSAAC